MAKNNYLVPFIVVLAIAVVLAFIVIYQASITGNVVSELECEQCKECIQDKALLDIQPYEWGVNLYDNSEFLFNYWIMNYGDVEAKNIKVRCKLEDVSENVAFSQVHTYGNLASKSVEFGETTPKKSLAINYNPNKEYSGYCYVESCDNCIILYKRIPNLVF